MEIKKYEAVDTKEALRMVREELGPEAVILSIRKIKKEGGAFGLFGRDIVEVTATNKEEEKDFSLLSSEKKRLFSSEAKLRENYSPFSPKELSSFFFKEETSSSFPLSPLLIPFYNQMVNCGVEKDLTIKLLEKVENDFSEEELQKGEDIKLYLASLIMELIKVVGPLKSEKRKQKIAIFIGPTGAGKTTTIAKLAGRLFLEEKKRVALITLDTYRIGAVEQLKIYADILGVPLEVAFHRKNLEEALRVHKDKEIILIDTAGRSQKDHSRMMELKSFWEGKISLESHLVLSSTTKREDLLNILERFQIIPLNRVIFTKLDETASYGNLLNHFLNSNLPFSYFTTGQKVPEDIEIASKERVADLILNISNGGEAYTGRKDKKGTVIQTVDLRLKT